MPIPAEQRDYQAELARRKQPAIQLTDEQIEAEADKLLVLAAERGGRPVSSFSHEVAADVVQRILAGKTLAAACREIGNNLSAPLVWYWQQRYRWFAEAIRRARAMQGESWGEQAVSTATEDVQGFDPHHMKANEMRRRTAADTLLKAAARRDPGNWGEKQQGGGAGVQIVIQTNLQAPDSGAYVAHADGQHSQVVDSTGETETNLINPDSQSDVSG